MYRFPWVKHIYRLVLGKGLPIRQNGNIITVGNEEYQVEFMDDGRLALRGYDVNNRWMFEDIIDDDWPTMAPFFSGRFIRWNEFGMRLEEGEFSLGRTVESIKY